MSIIGELWEDKYDAMVAEKDARIAKLEAVVRAVKHVSQYWGSWSEWAEYGLSAIDDAVNALDATEEIRSEYIHRMEKVVELARACKPEIMAGDPWYSLAEALDALEEEKK
jgi:hypothetical protein